VIFIAENYMRPSRLTVPDNESSSFNLRYEKVPYFTNPWHFHPELELNWVIAGAGIRYIGQSVERFESGEIVLLGKNLPHYWKNDPIYYQQAHPEASRAIIVRFTEDFVGEKFVALPESRGLQSLFVSARQGIKLLEPLREKVAQALFDLMEEAGFEQLLSLLKILHTIAHSKACEIISPAYLPGQALVKNNQRLSNVIAYLIAHFTEPVSLPDVAQQAHMNEAAFCRFFKSQTGQTFTQYLTELRIRYACELLSKEDESVTQICYQVGFENVSHFIQAFKKQRGITPLEFRKKISGKGFGFASLE
jgi:AraC-like DNA-binding protein